MVDKNLDKLNKELISDIKKEQKLEDISKLGEKKPILPFFKRKQQPKSLEPLKPLPAIKIPEPSVPSGKEGERKIEPIKEKVFSPEKKEKRGLFGGLFAKKEEKPIEKIKEPIEPLKPVDLGYSNEIKPIKPIESIEPIKPYKKEDFLPKPMPRQEKIEGKLIKSDFSLKELPKPSAGEKEVKPKKAKGARKMKVKVKKKAKAITRKQLVKEEKLLKKEERILEKEMKEKLVKKKVTDKERILKEKENILADKLISVRAKETRLENLRKKLDRKAGSLENKEKELEKQQKKYDDLIAQINEMKKKANEEIRKQKAEVAKREKDLENKEHYLRKKSKEVDIEDRAVDYAMSEFEKEKMKLEDDEFHAYLKSKLGEVHGAPTSKKQISIEDIRKAESLKVPDFSEKRLSIQESIQKCKGLISQRKMDQAKLMYDGIRLEFMKKQFPEPEKTRLYNQIRELFDSINLGSLNR